MYPSLRSPAAVRGQGISPVSARLRRPRVSRTVVLLGLNSMLTDIGGEMVNAALPLFLTLQLGLGALAFGAFAGGYQAVSALGRLASGVAGDRGRRHKSVAGAGYGLSAACKLGVVAAAGQPWLAAVMLYADRVGKGIRTAPRDALISLSTPRARLGEAFGVHRALDTVGAVLGPLLAFGVLLALPHGFTAIFAIAFGFGVAGLVVLLLLVHTPHGAEASPSTAPARAPLRGQVIRTFPQPVAGTLSLVAAVLGTVTIADSFVYLAFQDRTHLGIGYFPLLYVGASLAYVLLAFPVGRLADRVGRTRVLLGGYVALFAVYVLLLSSQPGVGTVVLALVLFGGYYACTDGVLMAFASALLPEEHRGGGLAMIGTASTLGQLVSSLAFGALWAARGPLVAVRVFGFGLIVAIAVAAAVLGRPALRRGATG